MQKISFVLLCALFFANAFADEGIYTYSKLGNIFVYSKNADHILQLTYSGKNKHPVLSPDGRWVAFVKRSNHVMPGHCGDFADTGSSYADEIWIDDLQTMKFKRLVKNNFDCDEPTKMIIDPKSLAFAPNSKTLYFETSAWVTSGAIHAVNMNGKNLRFVADGGEYHIVQHGHYRGDLIINQHHYHDKGGSYNWDWLFTPEGKQIKPYKKEI